MSKKDRIRLHKYVRDYLHAREDYDYSNPEIARNIGEYGVYVDGVYTNNRLEWVYPHQEIRYEWPRRTHGDFAAIRVLEETERYLVLFKPPGVVVQAGAGHQKDNLVEWLLDKYPAQHEFNPEQYPTRGLVHRLDKLTQGVLLVAKDVETLNFLQDQFRARKVTKRYLAVVQGVMTQAVHVKNYQARSKNVPTKNKLFWSKAEALGYDSKSRYARSYFRPMFVSRELGRSLVEVNIMTGRMHQIRLQAQALGHALVGDPKYPQTGASIPKAAVYTENEFEVGLRREEVVDLHNLNGAEFGELTQSIFGEVEFGLLSNYLSLEVPGGEVLTVQYYK